MAESDRGIPITRSLKFTLPSPDHSRKLDSLIKHYGGEDNFIREAIRVLGSRQRGESLAEVANEISAHMLESNGGVMPSEQDVVDATRKHRGATPPPGYRGHGA